MENKKLYVFGDSWTDITWRKDAKYYKNWSDCVADMLQMKNYNFGYGGTGNWRISQDVIEKVFLEDNNPDCVMILWSEPTRIPFGKWSLRPSNLTTQDIMRKPKHSRPKKTLHQGLFQQLSELYKMANTDVEARTHLHDLFYKIYEDYINQILYTSKILKERDIPFLMAQGFHPHHSAHKVISNALFNKVWDDLIKKYGKKISKNVLGWPFVKDFGGWNMSDKLNKDMFLKTDYHPNEKGELIIANEFLDGLDKIYAK